MREVFSIKWKFCCRFETTDAAMQSISLKPNSVLLLRISSNLNWVSSLSSHSSTAPIRNDWRSSYFFNTPSFAPRILDNAAQLATSHLKEFYFWRNKIVSFIMFLKISLSLISLILCVKKRLNNL